MAGGSDEHNAIAGRLAGLVFNRTSGTGRYYTPDRGKAAILRSLTQKFAGARLRGPASAPASDHDALFRGGVEANCDLALERSQEGVLNK